jgi:hypothetical protein
MFTLPDVEKEKLLQVGCRQFTSRRIDEIKQKLLAFV